MKKSGLFLGLLFSFLCVFGQATEINFSKSDWQGTLAEAKQANKYIFVDAHTSWCVPCKWMAANIFTNADVATFFNQNFINAKIDMEKGEGPELRKRYGVEVFPTLLFIDANGNLIHSEEGTREAVEFIDLGKSVLDPEFVSIASLAKRFQAGDRDRTFLKEYLMRLNSSAEGFQEALEPFKAGMRAEGLLDENSWTIFQEYFLNPESEFATYFLAHRPDFEGKYGLDPVNEKVYDILYHMGEQAAQKGDDATYEKAKDLAANSGLPNASALVCNIELRGFTYKNDAPNYVKVLKRLFDLPGEGSIEDKKFQAMIVARGCETPEELKAALKWSQEVVKVEQDYVALHTLALIQLKLGRTEDGMAAAEKAISAAKEAGEDYSATEAAIEKYGAK